MAEKFQTCVARKSRQQQSWRNVGTSYTCNIHVYQSCVDFLPVSQKGEKGETETGGGGGG